MKKTTESVNVVGAAMNGFNSSIHEGELEKYHLHFFESISNVFKNRSREYAKRFYNNLFPNGDALPVYLGKVKELIAHTSVEEGWLLKILRVSHDDLERKINCQECLMRYMEKNHKPKL